MFGSGKKTVRGPRGEELPEPNEGLPDSHRPSGLCPRCGKQSSFEIAGSLPVTFGSQGVLHHDGSIEPVPIDRVSSLICRHCKQGVAVVEDEHGGIHWWPLPETQPSPDVPEEIGRAFAEAATALSANCPRASAVMARRTLEAITVDKGQTQGTLAERLAALAAQGDLQPTLADWSKEVRLVGNVGAHFDPMQTVSTEDAQQLLSLVRELLRYLYELPAELGRRRSR